MNKWDEKLAVSTLPPAALVNSDNANIVGKGRRVNRDPDKINGFKISE